MGEARRRRQLGIQLRTKEYLDYRTGEQATARLAGDPLTFIDRMQNIAARLGGDPDPEVSVPCHGCRECCWHPGVDLHEDSFDAPRLPYLQTERREDGVLYLAKKPDGSCAHLGPDGCTVYQHRPHACRHYDCRLFSLTGTLDSYDNGHAQPVWLFEPKSEMSRAHYGALQLLGRIAYLNLLKTNGSACAKDVITAVGADQERFEETVKILLTIIRSPDAMKQLFGFDPSNPTEADIEGYQARLADACVDLVKLEDDLRSKRKMP